MRKLLFLLVAAAALAGAGIATSSGSSAVSVPALSHVYGGGEFGPGCFSNSSLCFPNARALAVDVHGDGRNFALGDLEYGAVGASETKVRVTCSTVIGNRVSVGGWVTEASNPAFVGLAALIYLVDNGPVSSPTPDQSSPIYLGTPGVPGDFPATFPTVCEPPTGNPDAPAVFQDLRGDIVIGTGI